MAVLTSGKRDGQHLTVKLNFENEFRILKSTILAVIGLNVICIFDTQVMNFSVISNKP